MKHLRTTLPGESTLPSSSTPLAILSTLFSWMRGRKVEDRGAGLSPAFTPAPVASIVDELNAIIDERFGIASCPSCGEKVAVLVDGVCLDCQPEDAA